ncbi:MAG: hypothetical protein IPM77_07585 [Crocinitomicaceae bacterium]|nr:hypothetical protein [Crocinitomicaceae bacterium]
MKQILILVLFTVVVLSCKKSTLVVIQAEDYVTGEGSAYAGMEYAVSEAWIPFFETKSKIVATGYLDENGYASFDLKMKNNRKYILGVSEPENICYGGLMQHYLEHEKNNHIAFKYSTCSYLKIIVNNINCVDENDEIKYTRTWLTGDEIGTEVIKHGCYSFEGSYFELPAGDYRYDWVVTKSGMTSNYSQNFILLSGDSLVFQIDY